MTEITAEGNASTTTTVIDNKNGSVPKSPGKVLKRTVTEDIVTTFSSPAAWLLVIALIITWSAVAIVMFDLVDYKNFSASSIAKIGSDPLKLVNDAVEETTDWIYGFFSLLSDIISSEGDEDDEDADEDIDKGEIEEPPLKRKEIHKERTEKQEKPEKKIQTKVLHREKGKEKEKLKGEKPEKKATHKEKLEKKERTETKTMAKEDKKVKTKEKTEEKAKKEMKVGKQEKVKPTAAETKETLKTPPKAKERDDKETPAVPKHEQKDQYAFCRYMIDMFVHGDLKPGQSPAVPPPSLTASRSALSTLALEEKEKEEEKKKVEKKVTSDIKKKEKGEAKKKSEKETTTDGKGKEAGKPETKQMTTKVTTQDSKKTKKTPEEQPKGKKQEKKEKHTEPAKTPKKEHPAPSEKHGKAKAEQDKEEIAAVSTKKALHGKKEEKSKTVEQEMKKEMKKSGKSSSDLKDKEPQVKTEEKLEQNITRPEQVIPHGKPEQKVPKQIKAITAEKTEKAEHQEKAHPSIKTEGTPEVTDSGKKKIKKSEKESKVPARQENLQVHNVTKAEKPGKLPKDSKDVPHSKKDKEVTDNVSSPKKQKSPISFFQCVYLDGYNGYGFQFPVTPAQHPGENPGKSQSPEQKQEEQ
ncbi:triadin isoform X10 [Arvicanthis niloticus]|uniref:triadin isoform X10 n=1 Tax=Arvicanthis niloticus TaxID=61156 RepID=UPI00402B190E